ncbi:MAG: TonB-dependent receptor [Bacteroidales bacterium]|nr:TonB-dependent receptor [Bacteroidales bacterium]
MHSLLAISLALGLSSSFPGTAPDSLEASSVSAPRAENIAAVPVQTLSGKELRRLPAANVADAIRLFSGVQVKDYGGRGGLKTVNVRSLGTHHTAVFLDGIMIDNAQNGTIDLGRLSLDNLEAISLYNGHKNGLLLSAKEYAGAASVHFRTRVPSFGKGPCRLKLSYTFASFASHDASVLMENRLGRHSWSSLRLEGLKSGGAYPFSYSRDGGRDTTALRCNADLSCLKVEESLGGAAGSGRWNAKAFLYVSDRGYPGAVVRGRIMHEDRQKDFDAFLQGGWERRWERSAVAVRGKYSCGKLRYISDPTEEGGSMYVDNCFLQHEAYGSASSAFNLLPWLEFSPALDLQFNLLDSDMRMFVFPRRSAIYGAVNATAHGRFFKADLSLLETAVFDMSTDGSNRINSNRSRLTPSADLWFQLSENLQLRAFVKNSYRMPTLNDLYYTSTGNRSLNPENALQYDLGAEWEHRPEHGFLKEISLSADAYHNEVKDKIVAVPTASQFQWMMLNVGRCRIPGVDASMRLEGERKHFSAGLLLRWSFQDARETASPGSDNYGNFLPYAPRHSVSAVLNLGLDKGKAGDYSLCISMLYTGDRYDSLSNSEENHIAPWHSEDLAVKGLWHCGKKDLGADFCLNNLLGRQYEIVRCYPMPRRNFSIRLSLWI